MVFGMAFILRGEKHEEKNYIFRDDSCSPVFLSGCGLKPMTLTWALFNIKGDHQVYFDALNDTLRKKNLPYQIQFVNIPVAFEGDYKTYINTYIEEIEKGDFDIISCPGIQNCYDMYKMMADRQLLVPLDDFLKNNETGKGLKTIYPSIVWDAVKYKGATYGIPIPVFDLNYYAVFNVDFAKKYGVDLSQVQFSGLEEYLYEALEGEKSVKNDTFVVSTLWQYFLWGKYETSPCESIYFSKESGKWRAESMIHSEVGVEHIRLLNSWADQGLIAHSGYSESISQGNFLITVAGYSYSEDAAENLVRNTFSIPAGIQLQAVEFPEFNLKFKGNGYKTGIGVKSRHKEDAMKVAAAIYSDEELSNALVYGKEGKSFYIENGLVFPLGEYILTEVEQQFNFGNPFLNMSSYRDSLNKKEELRELMENVVPSEFLNVIFDLEGIDESICQLNVLFLPKISGSSFWKEYSYGNRFKDVIR